MFLMRKILLASLSALVVGAVAWAGPPTAVGVWLDPSVDYQFENCAATGSAVQSIPNGKYMLRVFDENTTLTFGTGYDGGVLNNRKLPANFAMLMSFYNDTDGGSTTTLGCQSALGTGDLYLTGTR